MNLSRIRYEKLSPLVCARIRSQFSSYLDGEVSGRTMASIAGHLDRCSACREEFAAWRAMQDGMATMPRPAMPAALQERLREAIRLEKSHHTHLPARRRLAAVFESRFLPVWKESLAPAMLRAAAGLVLAASLLGGLAWMYAAPLSVEANDEERYAHLNAPRYLYSQVPPQMIVTGADTPILIDAKVDDRGRVYDFKIVEGPNSHAVRLQVMQNLLASVFRPASVFGEPVSGHVMLTYTGVSIRG